MLKRHQRLQAPQLGSMLVGGLHLRHLPARRRASWRSVRSVSGLLRASGTPSLSRRGLLDTKDPNLKAEVKRHGVDTDAPEEPQASSSSRGDTSMPADGPADHVATRKDALHQARWNFAAWCQITCNLS